MYILFVIRRTDWNKLETNTEKKLFKAWKWCTRSVHFYPCSTKTRRTRKFWLIVAFKGSLQDNDPTFLMSQWWATILCEKYLESVNQIQHATISHDHWLISLDIVHLFTSIYKILVIVSFKSRYPFFSIYMSISLHEMFHTINYILNSTYFLFNPIKDLSFNIHLFPSFAEMVMWDLKNTCLSILHCIFRYLDLWCIVFKTSVDHLINVLTDYNPSVQFTYELLNKRSFNFVDVSVLVRGSKLQTNWLSESDMFRTCY